MYTLLRYNDRLPSVAVAQALLNRTLPSNKLDVDGVFGAKTKAAVKSFQKPRGLGFDGVIGEKTWPRLAAGSYLDIVDAIDITDDSGEKAAIKRVGGSPILVGWQCNGIGQMMAEITQKTPLQAIFLLRFHGHGGAGAMGISDGFGYVKNADGSKTYLEDQDMSAITNGNILQATPALKKLISLFGDYGSAEMHHCKVAKNFDGKKLIQKLANIWRVPVTAGRGTQLGGGSSTFHFEGSVYTALPDGGSLKTWAKSLRPMPEMSVP